MSQSAALCAGKKKKWQQQWSKELTGSTCCSEQSDWPASHTERRQGDGQRRKHPKLKDSCASSSISCMGIRERRMSLWWAAVMGLARWSFRGSCSCTLLLPSTHRSCCWKPVKGSLQSDFPSSENAVSLFCCAFGNLYSIWSSFNALQFSDVYFRITWIALEKIRFFLTQNFMQNIWHCLAAMWSHHMWSTFTRVVIFTFGHR